MAKINNSDYPELNFSEAVKMIKQFHEKLNGKASNFKSLANAFDSSEKSGWFKVKVGDLRKYGLIEGRGEFKISDVGQDILFYNTKEEYHSAVKKALNNIQLFKTIYERVGKDIQDISNFRAVLGDITQAEKSVIQNKAEQIRNVYIDLISNINDGFTSGKIDSEDKPKGKKQGNLPSNMISASSGKVYIEMPKDERYIAIVESLLENLKAQIALDVEEEN